MKVIEQFIQGKTKDFDMCEDGIFVGDHMIAVIDGVTAKSAYLWDGKRSGRYAKDLLIDFLNSVGEIEDAEIFFSQADIFLKERTGVNPEKLSLSDYPRASLIVYNDYCKEIWSYGDCQCRINDEVHTHIKQIDRLNSDLRAFYLEYECLKGKCIDELKGYDIGRKQIEKNLLMQFEFENREGYFGYPVLNGQGIKKSLIKKYSVINGDEIILATDGYPVLMPTLEECEQVLSVILEKDPMCFRMYKSTKGVLEGNVSFDDRTFCRVVV